MSCGTRLEGAETAPDAETTPTPDAEPTSERDESSGSDEASGASDDEPTDHSLPVADPTEVIDVDLVTCPQCGARNAARRPRCARCGTALSPAAMSEDDTPPPTPAPVPVPPRPAADVPPPRPRPGRRRLVGGLVIAVGILVGAGLGLAAGLGLGPFASSSADLPAFTPAAYPTDPQSLRPATVGATTPAPGNASGPAATVDGDLTTAWVTSGETTGARLRHTFPSPVWLTSIRIANGDQADGAFDTHDRVLRAEVDLENGQKVAVTLLDQPGLQEIALPQPVITRQVTWTITEVAGTAPDVALSEIAYSGYVATDADAAEVPPLD
jgi:hypothetical protein